MSRISEMEAENPAKQFFKALPGYPFFPCRICVRDGFNGIGSCDHTVLERARAMHPGLILQQERGNE